jgi:alanyl-tRNA synthetase
MWTDSSELQSLNSKEISQVQKVKLREAHQKLTSEIADEAKAVEKAAGKKAVDAVTAFFTENPNARVCVMEIEGASQKALQAATQHIAKAYQRAAYLFSVDKAEGKVIHINMLPKTDVSKTFSCKQWIADVSKVLGGRGGGKDESSQGVGTEIGKIQEAIEVAKKSYQDALGSL